MALSTGNKVSWADIQAIYTKLNNCQTKFSITKTTAPANPGICKPNTISALKGHIFNLSSSTFVNTSFVSAVFNLSVPTVGQLLKADPFTTMKATLDTVYELCTFSSCGGFDSSDCNFDSGFGGGGGCNFDSGFDGSDCSFDSGFNGSNQTGADGYCPGFGNSCSDWVCTGNVQ